MLPPPLPAAVIRPAIAALLLLLAIATLPATPITGALVDRSPLRAIGPLLSIVTPPPLPLLPIAWRLPPTVTPVLPLSVTAPPD